MKLALILNVIDPRIGGVMIMGDRGTGKSTTIRAVADLLPEIAVVVLLALLIFGPKRLPQLGKTIGKTLKGLQTASKEFENEINKTLKLNENDE